jgi:hypothetical protein
MTTLKIVREASRNCEKNRLLACWKSLFGQWTGHSTQSKHYQKRSCLRMYLLGYRHKKRFKCIVGRLDKTHYSPCVARQSTKQKSIKNIFISGECK